MYIHQDFLKWNVPRDSSSVPASIDSVVIKKIKFGDQPHAEIHPKINKYDPRASFHKDVDQNALGILKRKLQSCLIESNFLLCHNLPSICVEGEPQDIYCEEVSFDGTDNFETDDMQESSLSSIPFNEFYDISQACFKEMVDIYVDSMSITFAKISEIEKNTRGQMSSEHWWSHRKERLTA